MSTEARSRTVGTGVAKARTRAAPDCYPSTVCSIDGALRRVGPGRSRLVADPPVPYGVGAVGERPQVPRADRRVEGSRRVEHDRRAGQERLGSTRCPSRSPRCRIRPRRARFPATADRAAENTSSTVIALVKVDRPHAACGGVPSTSGYAACWHTNVTRQAPAAPDRTAGAACADLRTVHRVKPLRSCDTLAFLLRRTAEHAAIRL
jgi:hypothetical protein